MNYMPLIVRYFLALVFIVFGANKFFNFLPSPEMGEEAMSFFEALFATGYMIQFIALAEIVTGLAFLTNRLVPVALIIFALVTLNINIVLFHLFLGPASGAIGYLVFLANIYLLFVYKKYYDSMLVSSSNLGENSQ